MGKIGFEGQTMTPRGGPLDENYWLDFIRGMLWLVFGAALLLIAVLWITH